MWEWNSTDLYAVVVPEKDTDTVCQTCIAKDIFNGLIFHHSYTVQLVNFAGTNFHELIKRCLSTNFHESKFHGHTRRHKFLFNTQLQRRSKRTNVSNGTERCIRGYHTYITVWVATVGEQLQCAQKRRNAKDLFAVAVLNRSDIVGHIPRKISRLCWLFIRKGGRITCTVTRGDSILLTFHKQAWRYHVSYALKVETRK